MFGQRPDNYLAQIGLEIPEGVEVLWTGPKVISDEISEEHIKDVGQLLRRPPLIGDNFFANDGPKNCKFLKLKYPTGRTEESFESSSGWAINPMNQPELSKILLLALKFAAEGTLPEQSFVRALNRICSAELSNLMQVNRSLFLNDGLDKISEETKFSFLNKLTHFQEPLCREVEAWLNGLYTVGTECLTD